jgi:beta-N-acetylhexosaminidase
MRDLARLAGAALCVGFTGEHASDALLAELRELGPCGVVIFARNVTSLEATRELVASIARTLADGCDGLDPLVCVDQEGGRVARLPFNAGLPAMLALAATRDETLAERAGRRLGSDVAAIGANVDFAPVLDLALAPAATALGTRTLGDDETLAAMLGAALVRGLEATGVAATLKHFPGHGESARDPHVDFPARGPVEPRDLAPFVAGIAAGARAVMSAHVTVAGHGDLPATLLSEILTGLLRNSLGFTGVTFSDCLQMDAIARGIGTSRGAVLALAAGADALIVSHDLAVARAARDAIVAAVECGELAYVRLEEAVARTRALRAELAMMHARRAVAANDVDAAIASEIARASIVCVRGVARLDRERPVTIVSFEGATADGIAANSAERPSLSLALRRRRFRSEYMRVATNPDAAMHAMLLDVLAAQGTNGERQLVVLARRAHLHAEQRALLEAIFAFAPGAIAVSALEPFDVPALCGARTILATCGDAEASIEALADVLAGIEIARGTLPVRVTAFA